jgi:RNA polymerase sigma-70 factor (ECF subfamily)
MSDSESRGALFEQHRRRLLSLAYRMLGSKADAEDMVQETYLRWHKVNVNDIRSPEAWLVSVTTRLCIDRLRVVAQERESYPGQWLPEPLVIDPMPSPAEELELAADLGMAFMTLLERLMPAERAAFLLHDVFDCSYAEIARILDKNETACRQMISRARDRVRRDKPRFEASEQDRRQLIENFMAAIEADNEQELISLFTESVTLTSDGGGKVPAARKIISGPARISRLFRVVGRKLRGRLKYSPCLINGEIGMVSLLDGIPFSATSFAIDGGRIEAIYQLLNPDKLKAIASKIDSFNRM